METDTSRLGLGAVLSQEQDDGTLKLLAYASQTLQQHKQNYGATEMEALGVDWAICHFRQYLYGHCCHVHTYHKALKSLSNSPHPSGKLARWRLAIQQLDLQIHYKPSHSNRRQMPYPRLHALWYQGRESARKDSWPLLELLSSLLHRAGTAP